MAYSIGPRIGIDGEAEFRRSIKNINTEYKALIAESRAVAAAMENEGDEQQKLESRRNQLTKQIDKLREKEQLLSDAVAKAVTKYSANSTEAIRLQGALYDVQATISGLEGELRDTDNQLDAMANGFEEVQEEAEDAGGSVLDFADVLKGNLLSDLIMDGLRSLGNAVKDFVKEMPEAAAEVQAASSQFEQSFGEMEGTASRALESIAEETGISASRMKSSFTGIYAFTKTMGADSSTALNLSSRAMKAAADSAAYYDKSIEDVTETLQSFLKGNYENDAALGISATETTRNTAANELYAMSFNELSEAQKVDVLLSMVEAGNEASGALGQAAREADAWENVTGELNEALYQLQATLGQPILELQIPIIQKLTEVLQAMTREADWQALKQGIDDFADSVAAAEQNLRTSQTQVNTTAIVADNYISRLAELEKTGLRTNQAQAEYAATVEALNALIPELNLSIDEESGYLNQSTGALRANVAAWKERAAAQLKQEKAAEVARAYAEAEDALTDARVRHTEISGELEAIESQLLDMGVDIADMTQQQADAYWTAGDASSGFSLDVLNLTSTEGQLRAEYARLTAEQEQLDEQIASGEQTLAGYESQLEDTISDTEKLSTVSEDTAEAVDEVAQAYEDAKTAAQESIQRQIGYFQELSDESGESAQEIIDNWLAQEEAILNYADNLQKAMDMGLDDILIQQLSDGEQGSMQILDKLVNDNEHSVDEINAAWQNRLKADEIAAEKMADVTAAISAQSNEMYSAAYNSGYHTISGLVNGVADNTWRLENQMRSAASRAHAAFNERLYIQSPSKVMAESGRYTVQGVVVGIEQSMEQLEQSMAALADAGRNAFLDTRLEEVDAFPGLFESMSPGTSSTTQTTNYGGVTLQIYQQPGEDPNALAQRVMEELQSCIEREEVAL